MFITSCSSDDENGNDGGLGNYNIALKVNGNEWKGNGQAAINDASGNTENSFLMMGANSENAPSQGSEFNSMLSGASLTNGNTIIMKGGFNGGEYFSLNQNGITYVTNNAPDGQEVGFVKIETYGDRITGTLSGTLYSESGETITVSEGIFSFSVQHF